MIFIFNFSYATRDICHEQSNVKFIPHLTAKQDSLLILRNIFLYLGFDT